MKISPYLSFNDNCEAAFKFYEKVFSAEITVMMTYDESPIAGKLPTESKKIIYASLLIGDQIIKGADTSGRKYEKPQGFHISVNIDSATKAEQIFKTLAEKGTVEMECQETFWAHRFGMVVDQFGVPWMINCEKKK